jgi:hypothetical protein
MEGVCMEYNIVKLTPEYAAAAQQLNDYCLGTGIAITPDKITYIAEKDGEVCGVCCCYVAGERDFYVSLYQKTVDTPGACSGINTYGVAESLCVGEEHRYNNVAAMLLSRMLAELEPLCDIIISTVWIKKNGATTARMLEKHNFTQVCRISRPWIDFDFDGTLCPECGEVHCICDCYLYTKRIGQQDEANQK